MRTVVCIVVYDRWDNIQHWLNCWKQCNNEGYQLVIINNGPYQPCVINRQNIGYDIGAFQDVINSRLDGFPEWDRLLWITDDTFPMAKDFIQQFEAAMKPGVGVACMQVSPYVRKHIRTTGFMIDKSTAQRLIFPADPIVTKEHCYQFEHRHPKNTFYDQVIRMGLKVVQVAPDKVSPLWDSGYWRGLPRKQEHDKVFGTSPEKKVTFICPIYNQRPLLAYALLEQTNPNWELWLIHDGPGKVDAPQDERIKVIVTPERRNNWGHSYRSEYLQQVTTDYVCITNADNYIVPVFIEYMLKGFDQNTIGVYCAEMVHSYKAWQTIPCRLERVILIVLVWY